MLRAWWTLLELTMSLRMDRQAAHSCINHTVAAFGVAAAETILTFLVQRLPGLQIAIVLEYMDGGSLGDILHKVSHAWSCAPTTTDKSRAR